MTLDALYRDLHAHPELAFQEHRTAGIAADHLRELGLEVITGIGVTGVVGILRNGNGPTVLLRADMDGLPVREATGLDYASTDTGSDEDGATVHVMHACGHDVHVTCLIGAVQQLAATTQEWSGTLIALFQPAEEAGGGAAAMIADGLYDRIPNPDVVLGQHVAPGPAGMLGAHSGPAFASADSIDVTLFGRGGHGSRPETTIDPVLMAASVVTRLQSIVAREVAATDTAVVSVGRMAAGTKNNIIPDAASLGLSVRAYDERVRERVLGAIERVIAAEAQASGAEREPDIDYAEAFPVTYNDEDATARVNAAFEGEFGADRIVDPGRVSGSEDVGLLASALGVPLVYWVFGGSDPVSYLAAVEAGTVDRDIPSNHSPYFAPVIQPTLDTGVRALVTAARAWLA